MNLFTVQTREQSVERLLAAFPSPKTRTGRVPLLEAVGLTLARDVVSEIDIPMFRRSTVDGYAVRARDTVGASESLPALLRLQGRLDIEAADAGRLEPDCAIYVPTGGPIPEEADAMVMIEYTEPFGGDIAVHAPVAVKENVVDIGEDVRRGAVVLRAGQTLRPSHVAALATIGETEPEMALPLRVAVLSTGDELVEPHEALTPGRIRDCNRPMLTALLRERGAQVVMSGLVRDDPEKLREALEQALDCADVVLLSGGSSVGGADHTAEIIEAAAVARGGPGILTHGIALKPGKPTISAAVDGRAVFGLPGHPAACWTVFAAVVAPLLNHLEGRTDPVYREFACTSGFQLRAGDGRELWQTVRLVETENGPVAEPVLGKSGMATQMSRADAFVIIPASAGGVRPGDRLKAVMLA